MLPEPISTPPATLTFPGILTQIMQSQDRSNETTEIDHQGLIVCLHPECRPLDLRLPCVPVQIRQEIENVLQVVHDLVVDRKLALSDERQVIPNLH